MDNSSEHIRITVKFSKIMSNFNNSFNMTESRNATNDSTNKPIFSIVGFTLGVFGNVLALLVLVKSAKRHKWKVFYKMITTLAIIDLIGILTTSPIVIAVYSNNLQWVGGQGLCNYFSVMLIFSGLSTCLLIGAMALDRYMAIVFPFKYRTIPKDKLAKFVISGILLFSAFVSFLPVFGLSHNIVHYPGSWCFPDFHSDSVEDAIFAYFYSCLIIILVLMTAYLNIWAIVRLIVGKRSDVRRGSNTNKSKTKRHVDVYIMVLLIVIFVVFAVCWTPFMVRIIINAVIGYPFNKTADLITLRMASFNQIMDPWVYLLFRRETLRKFMLYVRRKKTRGEDMFARFLSSTNQRNFSLNEAGNAEKIFTVNENQTTIKKTESRSSTAEITEITEL